MDSLHLNHSEFMSKSKYETAKQNQKFPFHFFFRFAVEGLGEETREKCKEIFWLLHTRVRERVRGALYRFPTQSERTERFRATTRSARAISRQNPADFVRNTFELRPIHTAKKNDWVKLSHFFWRIGWDSNSRSTFMDDGFQDRCLRPLSHLSLY